MTDPTQSLGAAPVPEPTIVREYGGATPEEAAAAYTREATSLVEQGYVVAAQAWSPQRTLVVTYQRPSTAPPPPPAVATDQPATPSGWNAAAAAPASSWAPPPVPVARPDRYCTRCGKFQSPAWTTRCEHCGALYAQYPPASTPPPAGFVPAVSGRSRGTTVVVVVVVVVFVLLVLITLMAIGLAGALDPTFFSI